MPRTVLLVAALTLASAVPLHAQRRFRLGPAVSSMSLQDLSGASHSFTGYGGAVALITGDDGESGLSVIRYGDLGTDSRVRRLTLYALDSYYYPVGTRGIAPFAATELGLARVTESTSLCLLLSCTDTVSTSSQVALTFGLGVRINAGKDAAAVIEGRFLEVPQSEIQALEARANVSIALGSPRTGQFTAGTLGPAASYLVPLSGPLRARRRHPVRAGLRGRGLAALGTGVRRSGLPARRLLHRGPGPRYRSGAARWVGVRSHEWPDDLELQRPPVVAAAQVGGERVRRAGGS